VKNKREPRVLLFVLSNYNSICLVNHTVRRQLLLVTYTIKNEKGKPSEIGFALIEKTISTLKNLESVMMLYIVWCGHSPIDVKNEIFAKILI